MQKPSPLRGISPFLELLLRATVLFPLGLVLMVLWLGAGCSVLLLPLIALVHFWVGDWGSGFLYIVGGAGALLAWRFLHRKFWQYPESLL